jgi:hypothetical protein
MMSLRGLPLVLLALAVADTAGAQTLPRPAPDLTGAVFAPRYAAERAERIPGVAKTAVDHRFEKDVTGSFGVLCGLQEGAEKAGGAAAARGSDPAGRFVGAKLRIAFR